MPNTFSVDVRCPNGPQRLFMKLKISDDTTLHVSNNLMEFACGDCKRSLRREGFEVDRVLHQYTLAGEFVETYIEY